MSLLFQEALRGRNLRFELAVAGDGPRGQRHGAGRSSRWPAADLNCSDFNLNELNGDDVLPHIRLEPGSPNIQW